MSGDIGQQRRLPGSYQHVPGQGPLILPGDFTELERNEVFKDAMTAYDAGDAYLQEFLASPRSGSDGIDLVDASALCFTKATELAEPSSGLDLGVAQALMISFEPQRGRAPASRGIGRAPLDTAISGSQDAGPGSVGLTVRAFQILVRYIITGHNEDFDEAVAILTQQVQYLKTADDSDGGPMLAHVRNYLTTACLQKCVRHEQTDEAVKRALELAQEAQEAIKAEMGKGGQGEEHNDGTKAVDGEEPDKEEPKEEHDDEDPDDEDPDGGEEWRLLFEASVLLAMARERVSNPSSSTETKRI